MGPGILECACLHLQTKGWSTKAIAQQFNRSYTTITNTLRKVREKSLKTPNGGNTILIPYAVIADRKHGPLQAVVKHLHDYEKLRFVDIAHALGRDPRNINAAYKEARQ